MSIKGNKNDLNVNNTLVEFLFLFAKLKNNYLFLKNEIDTSLFDGEIKNIIKETFYHTPDKELFNKDTLTNLYEIINNKTDENSTYYYYKLSNYNQFLLSDVNTIRPVKSRFGNFIFHNDN